MADSSVGSGGLNELPSHYRLPAQAHLALLILIAPSRPHRGLQGLAYPFTTFGPPEANNRSMTM